MMNTRQELLLVIEQLPEEQLPSLLEFASTLKKSEGETVRSFVNLQAFLELPMDQRRELLAQQAAAIAPYFQTGSEEMEWVDEYVDDENWDD